MGGFNAGINKRMNFFSSQLRHLKFMKQFDTSFTTSMQDLVPADDFRYPNTSKQIWTVNEAFIQRLINYSSSGAGRLPVEIAK